MKGNLILIDDEVMLLEKTAMLLEDIADKVFTADSGAKGLEIIKNNKIHCILCDINMPNMNGVEVLKKIRELKQETPFIFYTGHGSRELMKEAIKYGALDFLDKPCLDGLEEIVERGLQLGTQSESNSETSQEEFISEYSKLLNN
jgi:DNA-binding NtrC family response regulator